MQGVVFLDENDTKCILTRGWREAVPLASSSIPADRRFTYYDHAHTTGMDIKQTPLAVARSIVPFRSFWILLMSA